MEDQNREINDRNGEPDDKRRKLNAFELLMNSSLTSSIKSSVKKAKRKRRQSVQSDTQVADAVQADNVHQKVNPKSPAGRQKTNSLDRSRSHTPEIIDISSSTQPSDEEDVEDGIIGMKVRSPNTSRCSIGG